MLIGAALHRSSRHSHRARRRLPLVEDRPAAYNQRLFLHFQHSRKGSPCRDVTSISSSHQEVDRPGLSWPAKSNCGPTATATSTCRWICRTARGTIGARMWNATEALYRSFENGDYVRVEGTTQLFQGAMQLIVTRHCQGRRRARSMRTISPPCAAVEVDKLDAPPGRDPPHHDEPHLRNLAECFLMDEAFMGKFSRAPAGIKNHHAYRGGLLEHVVNLMEVVLRIAPCYPADRPRSAADRGLPARHRQDRRARLRARSELQRRRATDRPPGDGRGHAGRKDRARRKSSPASRSPRRPCCG